jgi:hypothetical protein
MKYKSVEEVLKKLGVEKTNGVSIEFANDIEANLLYIDGDKRQYRTKRKLKEYGIKFKEILNLLRTYLDDSS